MRAPAGALIVEMGCGHYSTPVIHEIAKVRGLRFKVFYSDAVWQQQMAKHLPDVEFVRVSDWPSWRLTERAFLVMLDNEELCVNRHKHLDHLVGVANFVLVHDADTYEKRGLPLRPMFSGEYYDMHAPHTMVIDCTTERATPMPIVAVRRAEPNTVSAWPSLRVAVVCAFVPGGDYDNHYLEYIQRLAEGLRANKSIIAPFFCITVMNLDGVEGVTRLEPSNNFEGWHIKAEAFNPALWEGFDRVLYLDLDTVICGDMDAILSNPAEFSMLRDYYRPTVRETGMVWFTPSKTESLPPIR